MEINQQSMDALVEMFRVTHNAPSTPCRASEVQERTIWAYWAQGEKDLPALFKLCMKTWSHHNPHWDIRVVDSTTIPEYLSEADLPNRFKHLLSFQTASDCIRLALLARYGGVYMDVNVLLTKSLDDICWSKIETDEVSAGAFFHSAYGTEALGGSDFVESWFLATKAGNPFFMRWRDEFRELLHNRIDTKGLVKHPLYQGLDLSGFEKLNKDSFGDGEAPFDFREYLAIHATCHRLLEFDIRLRKQWQESWRLFDAADTAFRVQQLADDNDLRVSLVWIGSDQSHDWDAVAEKTPLIKFRTPDYREIIMFPEEVLLDSRSLVGRIFRANGAAGP